MKKIKLLIFALIFALTTLLLSFAFFSFAKENEKTRNLLIGWASTDITPDEAVVLTGYSRARISRGVMDPIGARILVLESLTDRGYSDMVVMVSVDLISISTQLRDRINDMVRKSIPEINTDKIVLNATHTHGAPEHRINPDMAELHSQYGINVPVDWSRWGIDMGVMSPGRYVEFAAERIAGAIEQAWKDRKPGGISFGLVHASVGHNRLVTYYDGSSQMGGTTDDPNFSHIEGYEDSSLNLLYTWDVQGKLTGVIINVAVPSQVGGYEGQISADYWHDTRSELRRRLGNELFVFAQCASAGDQSPRILVDHRAEERMRQLTGRSRREQIAVRIADAVTSILPWMEENIDWNPTLRHRMKHVELSRRLLSEEDIKTPRKTHHTPVVETVEERFDRLLGEFHKMYKEFEEKPELKEKPNWYSEITGVQWRLTRAWKTLERYELQKTQSTMPIEVHVIRIGDLAMATNPFELYLDYGIQMKARSKAVQTFIVQLATPCYGYLPTSRSVKGGAYGAIPESTEIGPKGGRELVKSTLELIEALWNE